LYSICVYIAAAPLEVIFLVSKMPLLEHVPWKMIVGGFGLFMCLKQSCNEKERVPVERPAKRRKKDTKEDTLRAYLNDDAKLKKLSWETLLQVVGNENEQTLSEKNITRFLEILTKKLLPDSSDNADLLGDDDVGLKMFFARFDVNSDGVLDRDEVELLTQAVIRMCLDQLRIGGQTEANLDSLIANKKFSKYYKKGKKLGQGGQGAMYLCTDKGGNDVCVKFYSKSDANAGSLEDIYREYDIMKMFNSPRLARTFDIFQDQSMVYLVNEPYYGQDLTHLVANASLNGVTIDEKWLRPVFTQVIEGLAYLHKMGFMHCDIKPENVMIAGKQDWKFPNVVLIDFGLVQQCGVSADIGVCGTPGYIPPETFQTGYWVPKGDMFSAGVMFYQIVSGEETAFGYDRDPLMSQNDCMAQICQRQTLGQLVKPIEKLQQTQDMKNMLQALLEPEFKKRVDARSCLDHGAWFNDTGNGTNRPIPMDAVNNLRKIHKLNDLQRTAKERMLENLSLGQMVDLNELFHKLDGDGDGTITAAEAKQSMGAIDGVPQEVVASLVGALETAGCDLDYKAFMSQMISTNSKFETEKLREMFDEIDADQNGSISGSEVPALAEMIGFRGNTKDLLKQLDKNGDGQISFEEFRIACIQEPVDEAEELIKKPDAKAKTVS